MRSSFGFAYQATESLQDIILHLRKNIMRNTAFALALVFIVIGTATGQGGKPAKGDTDVPATSTINNSDGSGNFFRIQGDGLGSYKNGVDSVQSIVQGIGDWEMDAKASGARRVYIDFGDPVLPGDTSAPFSSAYVPTRFISKCASLGFKIRDMALGQVKQCPLATSFDFGGNTYRIAMNPLNFSSTENVSWTCLGTSGSRCSAWTLQPSTIRSDGFLKARGQLLKISTVRGKTVETQLGEFYFAFKIGVTTP